MENITLTHRKCTIDDNMNAFANRSLSWIEKILFLRKREEASFHCNFKEVTATGSHLIYQEEGRKLWSDTIETAEHFLDMPHAEKFIQYLAQLEKHYNSTGYCILRNVIITEENKDDNFMYPKSGIYVLSLEHVAKALDEIDRQEAVNKHFR